MAVDPRSPGVAAPSDAALSTGARYPRLFPDAVPVAITTWSPAVARSMAARWCDHGRSIPAANSADSTAGATDPGHCARRAVRAGTCSTWRRRSPCDRAASTARCCAGLLTTVTVILGPDTHGRARDLQ